MATQQEAADLVAVDGGPHTESRVDEYGYTWLTVRTDPPDVGALVTDLHAVNSALEVQGFGSGLLCSTVGFRADDGRAGVRRLPLQAGHLLPVLPHRPDQPGHADGASGPRRRRRTTCPIEEDTSRWMPIWGIPGLTRRLAAPTCPIVIALGSGDVHVEDAMRDAEIRALDLIGQPMPDAAPAPRPRGSDA